MGKRGKWFGVVKRVFNPETKEKKTDQINQKSRKKWVFGKPMCVDQCFSSREACKAPDPVAPPPIPSEEFKRGEVESDHAYTVAIATAAAAEAAAIAAQAAAEVVRLTTCAKKPAGKSEEEVAAIRIQTAFRGYLARRALRALRGLARLKSLTDGNSVKHQTAATLHCMQTRARVQSHIRSRRIRMMEENQALQRQLQLKHERELEALRASMGEDWDDSLQSKEQIEASLLNRHEAAVRRERAMAYAFSHQWKSTSRSVNPMFTDPNNPSWGWSWLERWAAARPWEPRNPPEKEPNSDRASVRSASRGAGETTTPCSRRDPGADKTSPAAQRTSRPPSRHSPSTPPSKAPPRWGRIKPPSPGSARAPSEDDSRSLPSMRSERIRRHSVAGSSARDDESLASSPAVPGYMVPTESATARSRVRSPSSDKLGTPGGGGPVGSVKKRLSFSSGDGLGSSPSGVRRHSGPPKVDASLSKRAPAVHLEPDAGNGSSR